MAKNIGKPLLPEWMTYPIFIVVVACLITVGTVVGLVFQFICFILQPKTIWPSLLEAKAVLIDIFHDLRN